MDTSPFLVTAARLFLFATFKGWAILDALRIVKSGVGIPTYGSGLNWFISTVAKGSGTSEAEAKEMVEKIRSEDEFSPKRWIIEKPVIQGNNKSDIDKVAKLLSVGGKT